VRLPFRADRAASNPFAPDMTTIFSTLSFITSASSASNLSQPFWTFINPAFLP
jgi:hypothetical protein